MVDLKQISRKQAKESGLSRYFTGKPCLRKHVCERWVSSTHCIECYQMRQRARYWNDPEHYNGEKKDRRKNNLERERAKGRQRYIRDKVKLDAASKDWKLRNLDRWKETIKRWAKRHPEIVREIGRRNGHARRARLRQSGGRYTKEDINRIFKAQRGRCAHPWCRDRLNDGYQIDHIQPISRGGSNWPRNLQLLCDHCNAKKWAKDPITHARDNGLLL